MWKKSSNDEPFLDRRTARLTIAVTLFVIGSTAFLIEFIIRPEIKPQIDTSQFSLQAADFSFAPPQAYSSVKQAWVSGEYVLFENEVKDLIVHDIPEYVFFELQLYLLRSMYLRMAWNEGLSLTYHLQSRFTTHKPFLSDVLYYRAHYIFQAEGASKAVGVFRQAALYDGKYAEKSNTIANRIERMNRPLW